MIRLARAVHNGNRDRCLEKVHANILTRFITALLISGGPNDHKLP
jgi:hypothetical protein